MSIFPPMLHFVYPHAFHVSHVRICFFSILCYVFCPILFICPVCFACWTVLIAILSIFCIVLPYSLFRHLLSCYSMACQVLTCLAMSFHIQASSVILFLSLPLSSKLPRPRHALQTSLHIQGSSDMLFYGLPCPFTMWPCDCIAVLPCPHRSNHLTKELSCRAGHTI